MSITATFAFDPSEHYRAARAVTRYTPMRYVPWGFAALALGILVWNVLPAVGEAEPLTVFSIALPYLLLGVFWLTLIPLSQRRAARKLPERDASARGPQERVVDETGFHSRGNGVALDIPWHAMVRAVETEEFFLFFYCKQCAYYVPKRVLAAPQLSEVRDLARAALADRARLREQ
ncbi:MAG TPA: YcxB family protein [Gemmatimonadaceae bacterium]|nr:YcxB family protein [Gemmatimonadaceae bacterium]